MDRNTLLAFFLISLILIFTPKYMELVSPPPPESPDENIAEIIARAAGFLGPCCDYLFETAKALTEAGIQDKTLDRLVRMVKGYREKS